jgi:adenine-specific DNA-methyltransferase
MSDSEQESIAAHAGSTELPEHLDLRSLDIAVEKQAELLRIFPEVRSENGKIDFDRLRRVLGELVDPGRERFGLAWAGKADCFKAIQRPSLATLLPCRDESVEFDSAENLIIKGDNLEVLKLLQKSYLSKVKMIYIDPPYNTGHDFVYPDNYTDTLQTYLEYTGQVDAEGRKFGTNADTDGRFHSKWLNMMYPRLYLARNLLQQEGVMFVSCDDNEMQNLRILMNEIFGEENFLVTFVWKKKAGGGDDSGHAAAEHEYILCYARDESQCELASVLHESPSMTAKYSRSENGVRYYLERLDKPSLPYVASLDFPIKAPDGTDVWPPQPNSSERTTRWRWGKDKVARDYALLEFVKDETGEWHVYSRTWEPKEGITPRSLLADKEHGRNRDGTREIADLLGPKVFTNPKPVRLLRHLLDIGAKDDDALVLDFFAGSGTTAQAILEMNAQLGGNRRFVLVQLPQPLHEDILEEKAGFNFCKSIGKPFTIAEITIERVRRVINNCNGEESKKLELGEKQEQDRGFRVYKLAESNVMPWNADLPKDADGLAKQLDLNVQHIRNGRTSDDLLYEILLKSGFSLTTKVQTLELLGKVVYTIAAGALAVCLERDLTMELIKALADRKPERVILLDEGFAGNDQLKTNAVQIMKNKGVTSFRTV